MPDQVLLGSAEPKQQLNTVTSPLGSAVQPGKLLCSTPLWGRFPSVTMCEWLSTAEVCFPPQRSLFLVAMGSLPFGDGLLG